MTASRGALKIAIFYYSIVPTGSIGRWHLHILRALCREHEFTVFATHFENPCPERIRWVRVPVLTRPAALAFVSFHLLAPLIYGWYRLSHGVRFDIIQFVSSDLAFGDLSSAHFCNRAYLKRQWRESPSHGLRRLSHWLDHRLRALAEPRAYRTARQVTVHSRGLAEELVAEYPFIREKLRFVPNVVDLSTLSRPPNFDREAFRAHLGLSSQDLALVFVALGAFERKGLPQLLASLQNLNEPHLKLIVVGGPADMVSRYRALAASLGLQRNTVFTGTKENIRPYLWASDAFILPSHYEAFPVAAVEGAAAGLPLVVTSLGGVEEFIVDGKNGIVVDRSTEGISRGLARLMKIPPEERHAMGKCAQRDVARYDVSHFVEAWRRIYNELGDGQRAALEQPEQEEVQARR